MMATVLRVSDVAKMRRNSVARLRKSKEALFISMCPRPATVSVLRLCEYQSTAWHNSGVWTSCLCGLYSPFMLNSPSNDGSSSNY